MKKLLLSISAIALSTGMFAQTNSDLSGNAPVTNGYLYQFSYQSEADLDSTALNCLDAANVTNATNPQKQGYSFVYDGGKGIDGSAKITMTADASAQYFQKFTTGNCGNMDGSPLDISGATNKSIRVRLYSSVAAKPFFTSIHLDGSNAVEGTKIDDAWLGGQSINANEWTILEFPIDGIQGNSDNLLGLDNLIGVAVYLRDDQDEYIEGTVWIDYIAVGDAVEPVDNSTNDVVVDNNFSVFPNPATDQINVNFEVSENATVELMDLTGKLIDTQVTGAGNNQVSFDAAELNAGLYLIAVRTANGVSTRKVLVK